MTELSVSLLFSLAADWVDTSDPNVKAEAELLNAAASIEAAAKKLAELRPRKEAVSFVGDGREGGAIGETVGGGHRGEYSGRGHRGSTVGSQEGAIGEYSGRRK